MTILVPVALFGWIPLILLLFLLLPPRRAVIVAFIGAWLFLPMAGYSITGLPDFTKTTATSYGALLGVVLFDAARLIRFRPSWIDLPMAVWFLVPLASSITNGLGLYDGVSGVFGAVVLWGLPYFIGRLYFNNLEGLRELAVGVFIGGLIYIPLCLYEIRMSPQLHTLLYGFHQHSFAQTIRFGGWRPTVFMQHGLAVGMWMTAASLIGVWLWSSGSARRILQIPIGLLVVPLLVTTILCKSLGALVLLAVGVILVFGIRQFRLSAPLVVLLLMPPLYMATRATGVWSGSQAVALAAMVSESHAGSLQMRLDSEDLLAKRAWQRPIFGWGSWGRNRVVSDQGYDQAMTDGLWIIYFGRHGLVGLSCFTLILLLPPAMLVYRLWPCDPRRPGIAPALALGTVLGLYCIDQLLNAMVNPVFTLTLGAVASVAINPRVMRYLAQMRVATPYAFKNRSVRVGA